MLAYIPAPWILWVIAYPADFVDCLKAILVGPKGTNLVTVPGVDQHVSPTKHVETIVDQHTYLVPYTT